MALTGLEPASILVRGCRAGLAILWPSESLSLSPLVVVDPDEPGPLPRVGFLNRVRRQRRAPYAIREVGWLDYQSGSSFSLDSNKEVEAFFMLAGPPRSPGLGQVPEGLRLTRGRAAVLGGVLAAIAGGVGLWQWDRGRLKISHHAELAEVWGAPTGVRALPEGAMHGYEVTTRGGRVLRVRHITAQGAPLAWGEGIPDQLSLGISEGRTWMQDLLYPCRLMEEGDREIVPFSFTECSSDDALPPRSWVELSYDEDGRVRERSWFSADDEPVAVETLEWKDASSVRLVHMGRWGVPRPGPWGTVHRDWTLDDAGRVVEELFTDEDTTATGEMEWVGQRSSWDAHDRLIERTRLEATDTPLSQGVAHTRYTRDDAGAVVHIALSDASGAAVEGDRELCANNALRWESGRLVEHRCLDAEGVPQSGVSGCAITRISYGDDWREQRCLDADGRATEVSNAGLQRRNVLQRWATLRTRFDQRGLPTALSFSGVDGALVQPRIAKLHGRTLATPGPARILGTRDADGHILSARWLGVDDEPMASPDHWAQWRVERDERGRVSRWSYLDVSGEPVLSTLGRASVQYVRDEEGMVLEQRSFGLEGEPVLDWQGIHATRSEWARGYETDQAAFGVDDEPVFAKAGAHRVRLAYDDQGNVLEESVWGLDGEPIMSTEFGFHAQVAEYTEGQVLTRFLDERRRPVADATGCWVVRQT